MHSHSPPSLTCSYPCGQSEEFCVYTYYTENYMESIMALESIIKDEEVVRWFKVRQS